MRRQGLLSAALQGAGALFVEPAEPRAPAAPAPTAGARATVAVFGLARGCGATVVARGLAAELAGRDPRGAAVVLCESWGGGIPLATPAATRLARACDEVPGASTRAVGRLALVCGADAPALADGTHGLAPLVFDAGSSALGGVPATLAGHSLIVTSPALEPALASVAADCVARSAPDPLIVLNRAREGGGFAAAEGGDGGGAAPQAAAREPAVVLPESRLGAQLALAGREPRGELGDAIRMLADLIESGE